MDAPPRPRPWPPHHSTPLPRRTPHWRCILPRCCGVAGRSNTNTIPFHRNGCWDAARLVIGPCRLVRGRPVVTCHHPCRMSRWDAIPARPHGPRRSRPKWWRRHTPPPACCQACPTLLRSGACGGRTGGGADGGTDGKMEGGIAVERDGDRRTRASHPIIITLSNDNKKNLNSNDNNNNDTIITIVLI